jgi:hypothetical protein
MKKIQIVDFWYGFRDAVWRRVSRHLHWALVAAVLAIFGTIFGFKVAGLMNISGVYNAIMAESADIAAQAMNTAVTVPPQDVAKASGRIRADWEQIQFPKQITRFEATAFYDR